MRVIPAIIVALFVATPVHAQILNGRLSGLSFGDGVDAARATLTPDCRAIDVFDLGAPQLPIAARRESHLICGEYRNLDDLSLERVILRFADGGLALVEARGDAIGSLAPTEAETMSYGGFEAHMTEDEVFLVDGGVAWVVRTSDMHPHPHYVPSAGLPGAAAETIPMDVEKPEALVFGASIEAVREAIEPRCVAMREFEIDPPSLPTDPTSQTQIDCFGFPYAGFPRKVEAVFADGALVLAWILTGKPEEDRIRAALVRTYGEPSHVTDVVEVFGDGAVVLRKDKPEILHLSEDMKSVFADQFLGQPSESETQQAPS